MQCKKNHLSPVTCHVSYVMNHISPVTNDHSRSHRPSPTMHSKLVHQDRTLTRKEKSKFKKNHPNIKKNQTVFYIDIICIILFDQRCPVHREAWFWGWDNIPRTLRLIYWMGKYKTKSRTLNLLMSVNKITNNNFLTFFNIVCQVPGVMSHMSPVTCHLSPVTGP